MQDCSITSALAVEILQSCTKPSIWPFIFRHLRPQLQYHFNGQLLGRMVWSRSAPSVLLPLRPSAHPFTAEQSRYFVPDSYSAHWGRESETNNVRHCTDDIFKCIFLDENIRFSVDISLKNIFADVPIDNIPLLVQIRWVPAQRPSSCFACC